MRLSDTERFLVLLLQNDADGARELLATGRVRSEQFLRLSEQHRVTPLLLSRLEAMKPLPPSGKPLLSLVPRVKMLAAAVNMRLRHELKLAVSVLESAGVDLLLIKGFAVDKNPLRQTSDIDVLIRERDLERACLELEEAGYRYHGSGVMSEAEIADPFSTLEWNNQFQFMSPSGAVSVEVHTNLFERDRIRLEKLDALLDNVDLFWEDRVYDPELGCHVPGAEATLALLCVHSTTKRSPAKNSYIYRHAYDIDRTIERDVDEDRFVLLCGVWKIEYYAYTALRLTGLVLDRSVAPGLLGRLAPVLTSGMRRLSESHLRCYRGPGRASLLHRIEYGLQMPFVIGGGFRKGLRWYRQLVFPPLYWQATRFGVSRSSPVILLTYIYGPFMRLWDHLFRRPFMVNEARSPASGTPEGAARSKVVTRR